MELLWTKMLPGLHQANSEEAIVLTELLTTLISEMIPLYTRWMIILVLVYGLKQMNVAPHQTIDIFSQEAWVIHSGFVVVQIQTLDM